MIARISIAVASRSCVVGYISIFSSSNVKDIRNMGKRWELLESNRIANSSTLLWSRNFNLEETIKDHYPLSLLSRIILEIPTCGQHDLTWLEMSVDALLKKESSFFSLTLLSVSSLLNKWMIWGNQVVMTWSSVLLQSAAIFSCRLLQSTGPELLHHNVWIVRHHFTLISSTFAAFFSTYQHTERSARSSDEKVW